MDAKDTTFSTQEIQNAVIQSWTTIPPPATPPPARVAPGTVRMTTLAPVPPASLVETKGNQIKRTKSNESTSTTQSQSEEPASKRKRHEPQTQSQSVVSNDRQRRTAVVRVPLNNWWKVTNCITNKSHCFGTTDSGFVLSQPFDDFSLSSGSEVPGEGDVVYVLGNHSQDEDQIEDNFGPWPKKMGSLNGVHLQFRSLQSESITEFSSRLAMSVSGSKLDHLSAGMLLFNTLKMINALEVRKTIKKTIEVSL